MKNNGKNKNLIRIAAMTSMTIFSLMAVFAGTLAWFNANRVINNGADSMQISSLGGKLKSISFHSLSAKNRFSVSRPSPVVFHNNPITSQLFYGPKNRPARTVFTTTILPLNQLFQFIVNFQKD